MTSPKDELGKGEHIRGLVILNYGDPAYSTKSDSTAGLSQAEATFLRILAYLLFSEAVSIPARYILEGEAMAQAVAWAEALLEAGILLPERRVEAGSFEELAEMRGLPEIGLRRAVFLDRHATKVRPFQYGSLARVYQDLMDGDLSAQGGFRRIVPGGMSGRYSDPITRAREDYLRIGREAPEFLVESVVKYAPELRAKAKQWAMARYYTTPLLFDGLNTREIPSSAAKLLVRGKVLDGSLPLFEGAAPAESAYQRIRTAIPAGSIALNHRKYCEALLEVRRSFPQGRSMFSDIATGAHLKDEGDSLSRMFTEELARQQRVRPGEGRVFTLVSSLLSGAAGAALGLAQQADSITLQLGSGLALGISSGAVTNEVQNTVRARKDRRQRPWILAIDQLENAIAAR